ncbi:MAG: hypothetical protein LBB68_04275 [Treponema sp.]|nr:hypothetical protein [Treponema sp.]
MERHRTIREGEEHEREIIAIDGKTVRGQFRGDRCISSVRGRRRIGWYLDR